MQPNGFQIVKLNAVVTFPFSDTNLKFVVSRTRHFIGSQILALLG